MWGAKRDKLLEAAAKPVHWSAKPLRSAAAKPSFGPRLAATGTVRAIKSEKFIDNLLIIY
jgi:hypothetical protein